MGGALAGGAPLDQAARPLGSCSNSPGCDVVGLTDREGGDRQSSILFTFLLSVLSPKKGALWKVIQEKIMS
jgi:hypothetical protein